MNPIYCTECLDRIPFEFFQEGKAAWSGGRPYLLKHAQRLGLKLDLKPPAEYAAALGFCGSPPTLTGSEKTIAPPSASTKHDESVSESPSENSSTTPRCELVIECNSDGVSAACDPVRVNLLQHASKESAVTLGRESTFTKIFRANVRISRRHCTVWMSNGHVYIQDLASANKTFLDGIELMPQKEYPFFQKQLLTMGAKHSAIRVTLDACGFPLLEKTSFATGIQSSLPSELTLGTGLFQAPPRSPSVLQSVD